MATRDDTAWLGLQTLTPRERARLDGILSRLSSPFAGERDAAASLAAAFMARHGLTSAGMLVLGEKAAAAPSRPAPVAPVKVTPMTVTPMTVTPMTVTPMTVTMAPRQERRRGGTRQWRGYDRRRQVATGTAVNISL